MTSSTARMAPPAPRKAASKLPGDIEVSASICTMPCAGEASRIASTYSIGRQHVNPLVLQRLLDGAQAIRPLGMTGRGQVIEAGGMTEEQGGHWCVLTRLGHCVQTLR